MQKYHGLVEVGIFQASNGVSQEEVTLRNLQVASSVETLGACNQSTTLKLHSSKRHGARQQFANSIYEDISLNPLILLTVPTTELELAFS